MPWYKRTIPMLEGGLEGDICTELLKIGIPKTLPPPFDIYMTKPGIAPPAESITVYFPPEAVSYCPAILSKYSFQPCDEPDLNGLDIFCTMG